MKFLIPLQPLCLHVHLLLGNSHCPLCFDHIGIIIWAASVCPSQKRIFSYLSASVSEAFVLLYRVANFASEGAK